MGRPRSWLNEKDFVEENKILVPRPPRCVCGEDNWRFGVVGANVWCACNHCGATYILNDLGRWNPIFPRVHSYWE